MKLNLTAMQLAVCKLPNRVVPVWAAQSTFFSLTQTPKEVSLVCDAMWVPPEIMGEKDWRCFEVDGVLDFSLVGILSELSGILAAERISIFVISTYDTDYILVREHSLNQAMQALKRAGHQIAI